jgi:5-methylthioadenosine/S-adenosylhomocysteine deaminase
MSEEQGARRIVDLRLDAHWIVPVEPAGVLMGHAVIVDGGRIAALIPAAHADAAYAPRETRKLPSHVLIPGLVNAHTHTAMTLLRGIGDDVPLKPWLEQYIWPREGRFVSSEFVFDGTLLGAAEMLQGGITCCNDMYFYPEASARAYEIAGMRALLGLLLDWTPYAADDVVLRAAGCARRSGTHLCSASPWRRTRPHGKRCDVAHRDTRASSICLFKRIRRNARKSTTRWR